MTTKERALAALMEERGYSPGLVQTALLLLGGRREELDELIAYVAETDASEDDVVGRLATLCGTH